MSSTSTVSQWLSAAQLAAAARREPNARVRCRILAIRHLVAGHRIDETAGLFALGRTQLYGWVRRYNAVGLAGLADRPRSGRPTHLPHEQEAAFLARLHAGPPPEAGLSAYRGEDLRRLLKDEFEAKYSLAGCTGSCTGSSNRTSCPGPSTPTVTPTRRPHLSKNLPTQLADVQRAHP
ncbi:MAG TPA: helix-turn-helix domain-containing protein [Methylocaldum sp.]|nr:helix-turn-helix domain-containing protein [Methylocaldum sp.]HYE36619.1 helix-turn-helix domain-containing protein [Methylocaldum sp.]